MTKKDLITSKINIIVDEHYLTKKVISKSYDKSFHEREEKAFEEFKEKKINEIIELLNAEYKRGLEEGYTEGYNQGFYDEKELRY